MHIMRSQILKFVDSKRNISFTLFKKKTKFIIYDGPLYSEKQDLWQR